MILDLCLFNNREWKQNSHDFFSFIFNDNYAAFAYNDSQLSYSDMY